MNLDILNAQKLVYEPSGLFLHSLVKEEESEEYGAHTFHLNNLRVAFRVAKITPTKIGQFVTFWKRIGSGPIIPYDNTDPFDLLVISTRNADQAGQFVFPKDILLGQGVISHNGLGGKRAIRVYPPCDCTQNRQAKNTQAWQVKYFFEIKSNENIDATKIQKLFSSPNQSF